MKLLLSKTYSVIHVYNKMWCGWSNEVSAFFRQNQWIFNTIFFLDNDFTLGCVSLFICTHNFLNKMTEFCELGTSYQEANSSLLILFSSCPALVELWVKCDWLMPFLGVWDVPCQLLVWLWTNTSDFLVFVFWSILEAKNKSNLIFFPLIIHFHLPICCYITSAVEITLLNELINQQNEYQVFYLLPLLLHCFIFYVWIRYKKSDFML